MRLWQRLGLLGLALVFVSLELWMWGAGADERFVRDHAVVTRRPLSVIEWRNIRDIATPAYFRQLAALHRQGYNTLFVAYDSARAANDSQGYETALDNFAATANASGVNVGLVAGDPSWGEPAHFDNVAGFLSFVQAYNAGFAHRIVSAQLDIEPYLQGASMQTTAQELAAVAQRVGQSSSANSYTVGFVVPFWLANDAPDTSALLRTVAGNHSTVMVMDYRNQTSSPDGTVAQAAPFLALARKAKANVVLALDASGTTPNKTTFLGHSTTYLRLQQYRLDQAETAQPSYAGQAVNNLQALGALRP